MNNLETFFSKPQPLVESLGWTLVHFLWQGATIAGLFAVVLAFLRRGSANSRYLAGCVALAVMTACPVVTFWKLRPAAPAISNDRQDVLPVLVSNGQTELSDRIEFGSARVPGVESSSPQVDPNAIASSTGGSPTRPQAPNVEFVRRNLPWLVAAWLVGVLLLSARLLAGCIHVQRIKRRQTRPAADDWQQVLVRLAGRLRVSRPVRLLESALVEVPMVVGWLRPVILLPAAALAGLTPQQLEALIAHELAHIRRHDYLVNLLQTVIETLLFYHPAVWWVSNRIRVEREECCDDLAVSICNDRVVYARALASMEAMRGTRPQLVVAADGGPLLARIRRLVGLPAPQASRSAWWLVAAIALAATGALGAGMRLSTSASQPQESEARLNEEEVEQGLTYTGQVTDHDTGQPIESATVVVRQILVRVEPESIGKVLAESKHQTNADGKYSFAIQPEHAAKPLYIKIEVHHPKYAPIMGDGYSLDMIRKNQELGDPPFFAAIRLRPAAEIHGQVVTPDGEPAAGVRVLALTKLEINEPARNFEMLRTQGSTDDQGRFRLMPSKDGRLLIYLDSNNYSPFTKLVDGRGDLGRFSLQEGITLKGKLLDSAGQPLPARWVVARRTQDASVPPDQDLDEARQLFYFQVNQSALTNERGEYALAPLPAAAYTVAPAELSEHWFDYEVRPRPLSAVFYGRDVTLKAGAAPDPLDFRAVPHVSVEVQCVNSKDEPQAGQEISIQGGGAELNQTVPWNSTGITDSAGKVRLLVPRGLDGVGLYTIDNEHHAVTFQRTSDSPPVPGNLKLGIVNEDMTGIILRRHSSPIVLIKVSDEAGASIGDVEIRVFNRSYTCWIEKHGDGRFRTAGLMPDAEATISVKAPGYQTRTEKITLPESRTKDIEVVLLKEAQQQGSEDSAKVSEAESSSTQPNADTDSKQGGDSQNRSQPLAPRPAAGPEQYATSKQFGMRRDLAPGLEVPVLNVKVWAEREATVDMGYSTANPRSFLPRSVIEMAGAKIVGRIDLEKDDPQSLMFLALSGANRANQKIFDISRIDGWDLGVGPRGGVTEVLVLSEGEPKIGMVGTEWARQARRGDAGFIHAAAGPVLYFGRFKKGNTDDAIEMELVPADKLPAADKPAAEDAEPKNLVQADKWGHETAGLRTRLVMLTGKPTVGQPFKFRLEMKNFGDVQRHYDPQNVAPFRVISVKKENGDAVPYIGLSYQTAGGPKPIKPGETVVLWDNEDVAESFLLAEPGKYVVQSSGAKARPLPPIAGVRDPEQSSIPASNAVTVELAPGKLPDLKAMFVRMREILPKEKAWRISMSGRVIFFTHSPTNLKKDVTTIQLWFDEKEHPPGYSLGEGTNKVPVDRLGKTKLGFAYMTAPPLAKELWPEHVERIRKHFDDAKQRTSREKELAEAFERQQTAIERAGQIETLIARVRESGQSNKVRGKRFVLAGQFDLVRPNQRQLVRELIERLGGVIDGELDDDAVFHGSLGVATNWLVIGTLPDQGDVDIRKATAAGMIHGIVNELRDDAKKLAIDVIDAEKLYELLGVRPQGTAGQEAAAYTSSRGGGKPTKPGDEPGRQERWQLVFPAGLTQEHYARMLDVFNMRLTVETDGVWTLISNVSDAKPRVERRDEFDERWLHFTPHDGRARPVDRALVRKAGVIVADDQEIRLVSTFEMEQLLARLERDYLKRAKNHTDLRVVRRTRFVLAKKGSGFEFQIESQEYFGERADQNDEKKQPDEIQGRQGEPNQREVEAATVSALERAIKDTARKQEQLFDEIKRPWTVCGQVTDADGKPMPGVTIRAHCGAGTLRMTGETETGDDGRYELRFGPGIWMAKEDKAQLQAATISVDKPGYFEKNLHRQGDRLAAYTLEGIEFPVWGKKDKDAVFLPGEPKEINFVMLPAAKVSGTVVDQKGKPLEGYRMSLTGADLPPSSSALASGDKTDENGRFEFPDIPTGYRFQILIEPPKAEPPWLAWASAPIGFRDPGERDFVAGLPQLIWVADRFEIKLAVPGQNWRKALQRAANSKIEFQSSDSIRLETKGNEVHNHVAKLQMRLGLDQPLDLPGKPDGGPPKPELRNAPKAERRLRWETRGERPFDLETVQVSETEQALVITGGVTLLIEGVEGYRVVALQADRLVMWRPISDAARPAPGSKTNAGTESLEMYLEGNAVLQWGSDTTRAAQIYYDADAGKMIVSMDSPTKAANPNTVDAIRLRATQMREKAKSGGEGQIVRRLRTDQARTFEQQIRQIRGTRKASGSIVNIDHLKKQVHVDRGSADQLPIGTTFSVWGRTWERDRNFMDDGSLTDKVFEKTKEPAEPANGKASAPLGRPSGPKARLEIVAILGPHLSLARITEDDQLDPITPGDLVFSPIWAPGRPRRFALAGQFDVLGHGVNQRDLLVQIISQQGGLVDAILKDDGAVEGEIKSDTDWLVLGSLPGDAASDGPQSELTTKMLAGVVQLKKAAHEFGVEVIDQQKLFDLMGLKRQVGLDK